MYRNQNDQAIRRIPVHVIEDRAALTHTTESPDEVGTVREPALGTSDAITAPSAEELDWQSLALHLKADMDNFRKRQVRRADEAIAAERERLLRLVLPVADNLDRALSYDVRGNESLQQGVELTYRGLMRFLEAEGVTRVEAVGQPFTPELHEAVSMVPADSDSGIVVEELEKGYKLGGKLLRPARVIVAA